MCPGRVLARTIPPALHVRWGRRLVYRRLRLDGWSINHKRVQRIWREEGLQRPLPRKRKRARPTGGSRELLRAEYPHHVWAIDFQFDQTMDGRTLKFLNVIDEFSRVCLAIRVGRRCQAMDMIDRIEELLKLYPAPTHLRMDNGPEFIATALNWPSDGSILWPRSLGLILSLFARLSSSALVYSSKSMY